MSADMSNNSRMKIDYIILFVIFIIFATNSILWIKKDIAPPTWDESHHLILSLKYYNVITNINSDFFWKVMDSYTRDTLYYTPIYPPFFHLATTPLYMIFGTSEDSAVMINILFVGIMIFSIYKIGTFLFNRETGLLSAFLAVSYAFTNMASTQYLIDMALVSIVSLSIWLLLSSKNFTSRKYSILFGISFGLGMLTKAPYIFFLLGLLTFVSVAAIRTLFGHKDNLTRRKIIINIILFLVIGSILTLAWYIPNLDEEIKELRVGVISGALQGKPEIFTIDSLMWYPRVLISHGIGSILLFIPFVIGLIVAISQRRSIYLLLWILVPYVFFTLTPTKDIRYIAPTLPAMAILSSFWIFTLKNRMIKTGIILLVIIFSSIQFYMAYYNADISGKYIQNITIFRWVDKPVTDDWRVEDILDKIYQDTDKNIPKILVLADMPYFNKPVLTYYAYRKNYTFSMTDYAWSGNIQNDLPYADYVITKTYPYESENTIKIGNLNRSVEYFYNNTRDFKVIYDTSLPDNSTAYIYKRSKISK